MTKFRATEELTKNKKSIRIGWPNPKYNPDLPNDHVYDDGVVNTKEVFVDFGGDASKGEVLEAEIPDKVAVYLKKKCLEKPPVLEVVPTSKR